MVSLKNGWTHEWLKSDWVSEFMKQRFSFTTLDKKKKKKKAKVRFTLRISQYRKRADKNSPKQFLWIKVSWDY